MKDDSTANDFSDEDYEYEQADNARWKQAPPAEDQNAKTHLTVGHGMSQENSKPAPAVLVAGTLHHVKAKAEAHGKPTTLDEPPEKFLEKKFLLYDHQAIPCRKDGEKKERLHYKNSTTTT